MSQYSVAEIQKAWDGLMVSHPRFGGGIVMRVVHGMGGKILVAVHFASGLKKSFVFEDAMEELRSLWGYGSADLPSGAQLERDPEEKAYRLNDAQFRHECHSFALETDLMTRLEWAAGRPPVFVERCTGPVDWAF